MYFQQLVIGRARLIQSFFKNPESVAKGWGYGGQISTWIRLSQKCSTPYNESYLQPRHVGVLGIALDTAVSASAVAVCAVPHIVIDAAAAALSTAVVVAALLLLVLLLFPPLLLLLLLPLLLLFLLLLFLLLLLLLHLWFVAANVFCYYCVVVVFYFICIYIPLRFNYYRIAGNFCEIETMTIFASWRASEASETLSGLFN